MNQKSFITSTPGIIVVKCFLSAPASKLERLSLQSIFTLILYFWVRHQPTWDETPPLQIIYCLYCDKKSLKVATSFPVWTRSTRRKWLWRNVRRSRSKTSSGRRRNPTGHTFAFLNRISASVTSSISLAEWRPVKLAKKIASNFSETVF